MLSKEEATTVIVNRYVDWYEKEFEGKGIDFGERFKRGAALLIQGHVLRTDVRHYTVRSQSDPTVVYEVNGSCLCPDATKDGGAPQGKCKHRIAVHFDRLLRGDLDRRRHLHGTPCLDHGFAPVCYAAVDQCDRQEVSRCPQCEATGKQELTKIGAILETVSKKLPRRKKEEPVPVVEDVTSEPPEVAESPDPAPLPASAAAESEMIAQKDKPLDYNREQYEEPSMQTIYRSPLPEAPVSMCITLKLPDGNTVTYTMRGHDDASVLERLPHVLATLERIMHAEPDHEASFLRRLMQAFAPMKQLR